jgi:hypothetical protein
MQPSDNRKSVRVLVVTGLLTLATAGLVYDKIGQRQDHRRFRQIGRSVDIGGRRLNIFCWGEGGPVVVFDTYGHMSGYSWSAVQSDVAKFTRACWYDRAAYGWSDPASMPRTFQSVASDLRELLHAAAVRPPYIFVGGGDAAFHIRVFHGLYPSEVAGVVMVNANDSYDPQLETPESAKGAWARTFGTFAPSVRRIACVVYPGLAQVGLIRLAGIFQGLRRTPSFNLTARQQAELDFLSDNPTARRGGENCAREQSMDQVRTAGNFGDVPLIVIASEDNHAFPRPTGRATAAWNKRQIEQTQPSLAKLSSRGRFVPIVGDVTANSITTALRELIDAAAARPDH